MFFHSVSISHANEEPQHPDFRNNFATLLFRKSKPLSLHSFLQKKISSVANPKSFRRFIINETAEEFHETAEEKIKTPIHFSRTAFEFGNVGSAEIFIGSLLYGKRKHVIRNRRSKKMLLCFVYSKICPIFANCKQDGKNMNSYLFSLIITGRSSTSRRGIVSFRSDTRAYDEFEAEIRIIHYYKPLKDSICGITFCRILENQDG